MPLSNPLHLPATLHFAEAVQPHRILDAGIGMGCYGFLLRQHLEVAKGRITKKEWKLHLDGVEIFETYRNPVWDYAYDEVLIGDIRTLEAKLGNYDLIICNDVLEHFDKTEAISLVQRLLRHSPVLIATTPNRFVPQTSWGGNEAERHRCILFERDFPNLVVTKKTGITTCYVCCTDTAMAKRLQVSAVACPVPRLEFLRHLGPRVMRKFTSYFR
jgi:hypothetical protein